MSDDWAARPISQTPDEGAGPFAIGSKLWPGLAKLMEEMGELQQVLGKLIATNGVEEHWDGSNLREKLYEELGDVRAAVIFFAEMNGLSKDKIHDRADHKLRLFRYWHNEQEGKKN